VGPDLTLPPSDITDGRTDATLLAPSDPTRPERWITVTPGSLYFDDLDRLLARIFWSPEGGLGAQWVYHTPSGWSCSAAQTLYAASRFARAALVDAVESPLWVYPLQAVTGVTLVVGPGSRDAGGTEVGFIVESWGLRYNGLHDYAWKRQNDAQSEERILPLPGGVSASDLLSSVALVTVDRNGPLAWERAVVYATSSNIYVQLLLQTYDTPGLPSPLQLTGTPIAVTKPSDLSVVETVLAREIGVNVVATDNTGFFGLAVQGRTGGGASATWGFVVAVAASGGYGYSLSAQGRMLESGTLAPLWIIPDYAQVIPGGYGGAAAFGLGVGLTGTDTIAELYWEYVGGTLSLLPSANSTLLSGMTAHGPDTPLAYLNRGLEAASLYFNDLAYTAAMPYWTNDPYNTYIGLFSPPGSDEAQARSTLLVTVYPSGRALDLIPTGPNRVLVPILTSRSLTLRELEWTALPPPAPSYQDRVRLTISKQASNVGRSGAIQFADYALSLTVTPDVRLEAGSAQVIGHALDPATPALSYYVKSISEDNGLLTYTGETILARMARERPDDFVAQGPFTGKQALETILTHWAAKYTWLQWDELPEFYLSGDTQMPMFPGLILLNAQDGDGRVTSRKTMRQWLEDYFKVFEGYTFQAAATGKLRVVPPPWLDASPRVTLTQDDFLQIAEGTDTESIRNLAVVTSQGLEFPSGEVEVVDEPYTYPGTGPGGAIVMNHEVSPGTTITVKDVSGTVTYQAGVDYLFYNPGSTGHSEIQRLPSGGIGASATIKVSYRYKATLPDVMVPSGFALWGRIQALNNFVPWGPKPADLTLDYKPLGPTTASGGYAQPPILDLNNSGTLITYSPSKWPLQENILLTGDSIEVRWNVKDWLSQWQTGDIGPYDNPGRGTLPLDNQEHLLGITVFTAPGTDNFSPQQAKMWLWGQWAGDGIFLRAQVWLADQKIPPPLATGIWVHGIWVQLNGSGRKLQKSSRTYIGRYTENDIDLPGVVESRAAFGPREESFDTGLLSIPDDALLARIARAKVLERLNPAQIVVAQIAPPFRVGMEDIGREFILPAPSGGTRKGILESLDYSETHESGGSALSLTARFRVTESLLAGQGGSSWVGISTYGQAYYTGGVFAANSGGGVGGSPGGGSGGGGPTLPSGFPPTAFHWMGTQNLSPQDVFSNPSYYQNLPFNSFIVNTDESWSLLLGNSIRSKSQIVNELVQLQAALPGRGIIVILHKQAPPPSFLFDDAAWGRICANGAVWAAALEEAKSKGVNVMAAVDPEGNVSDWGHYGDASKAAQRGSQFATAVHPVSISLRWLWLHGLYNGITGIPPEVVGQVSIPGWTPDPVAAQTGGGFRAQAAFQGQFIAGGIGIKPRRWAINGVEVYQLRTHAHFVRTLTYMRQLGQIISDPLILPPALAGNYTDWVATGASVSITTGTGPLPVDPTSMNQALNNALVTADSDAIVWCYAEAEPSSAVYAAWAAAIADPHEV
jgi:hypothetical protein